jgi:hypothetical protein
LSIDRLSIDTKTAGTLPRLRRPLAQSIAVETFSIAAVNPIKAGVTMIPYADATFARAGALRMARHESPGRPARRHLRPVAHNRNDNGTTLLVHRTQRGSTYAKSKNRF